MHVACGTDYIDQTILRNFAIPNYLKPMRFQKIRFLGGKLGSAIAEEYDVSMISDLLSVVFQGEAHLHLPLEYSQVH